MTTTLRDEKVRTIDQTSFYANWSIVRRNWCEKAVQRGAAVAVRA